MARGVRRSRPSRERDWSTGRGWNKGRSKARDGGSIKSSGNKGKALIGELLDRHEGGTALRAVKGVLQVDTACILEEGGDSSNSQVISGADFGGASLVLLATFVGCHSMRDIATSFDQLPLQHDVDGLLRQPGTLSRRHSIDIQDMMDGVLRMGNEDKGETDLMQSDDDSFMNAVVGRNIGDV